MLKHPDIDVQALVNIKAEIEAGKPPKQAVAIGYSVQRQAMKDAGKKPTSKKEK